jgi:hypothetical protein
MARLGPLVLLFGLLARCGSGGAAHAPVRAIIPSLPSRVGPARVVPLQSGEQRTFPRGALRPGDVVACTVGGRRLHLRIPNRPIGAWSVDTAAATPSGTSGELQARSNSDGSVTASCGPSTS